MIEQKYGVEIQNDNIDNSELKARSSKKVPIPTLKAYHHIYESDLVPFVEYECENCRTVFDKETQMCEKCGSKYIKRIEDGRKCCFIEFNRYKKTIMINNQFRYLTFALTIAAFITLLVAACIAHSSPKESFVEAEFSDNLFKFELFAICLIFIPLFNIVDKWTERKKYELIKFTKPKKYLFIKNINYEVEESSDLKMSYLIVKYNDNGKIINLKSKDAFFNNEISRGKLELLIDPQNTEDYEIGYDLEKQFK